MPPETADAGSPTTPAADAPTTIPTDPSTATDFDERWTGEQGKAYATRLRNENKAYRERFAPYEQAFDGMTNETRDVLVDFAKAVRTGDNQSITGYVGAWAEQFGLTKAEVQGVVDAAEEDGPITAKKLQEELAKVRQEQVSALQQQQINETAGRVSQHLVKLGYDQDADPIAWAAMSAYATKIQRDERCDAITALDKAHEALDGWTRSKIDAFVASRGQDARRVPAPSSNGGTPTKDTTPKSIKEADAALKARLGLGRT